MNTSNRTPLSFWLGCLAAAKPMLDMGLALGQMYAVIMGVAWFYAILIIPCVILAIVVTFAILIGVYHSRRIALVIAGLLGPLGLINGVITLAPEGALSGETTGYGMAASIVLTTAIALLLLIVAVYEAAVVRDYRNVPNS